MNVEKINNLCAYSDENFLVRNEVIFKMMKHFEKDTDQFIENANKQLEKLNHFKISKYEVFVNRNALINDLMYFFIICSIPIDDYGNVRALCFGYFLNEGFNFFYLSLYDLIERYRNSLDICNSGEADKFFYIFKRKENSALKNIGNWFLRSFDSDDYLTILKRVL